MNLTHTRIATYDLPRLVQFYTAVTQIKPIGGDDYVEFRSQVGILAICSQQTVDLHNAGATTPAASRSVIIEFQVGVDQERARLSGVVEEFVLEPTVVRAIAVLIYGSNDFDLLVLRPEIVILARPVVCIFIERAKQRRESGRPGVEKTKL